MSYVAVAVGVGTLGYGIYQSATADTDVPQPRYKIPKAHKERMSRLRAREALGSEMPGQQLMEQKIGAARASTITAYKEMGDQASFQDYLAQSMQMQQDKLADIGIKAAQYRLDRAKDVDEGLLVMAGEQEKVQRRDMEIAQAKLAEGLAQKEAGMQNITGGAQMAAGGLSKTLSNGDTTTGGNQKTTGGNGTGTGAGQKTSQTQTVGQSYEEWNKKMNQQDYSNWNKLDEDAKRAIYNID
jgi:hypothetical protein